MLKQGIQHMELYFIIKTILCKTVLMRRQIYMYISLIMKCQQLQMKLLTFKNSNKKSLLLTKRMCICSSKRFSILLVLNFPSTECLTSFLCKRQTWSLFSAIRKSRHGLSASVSTLQLFCYFKKQKIYIQYTSIFFILLSYFNHIISACMNVGPYKYRSWREYRLQQMFLHCS